MTNQGRRWTMWAAGALGGVLALLLAGSVVAATPKARYRVTFRATWSAQTHPLNFPASAHFSNLVGGTHDAGAQFWAPGQLASQGIKDMAERGLTAPLASEVTTEIGAGDADAVLLGGNIASSPGTTSFEFDVASAFPLVTLVSMIAPSPDWFVGVHDLALLQNGEWVPHLVVPLHGYDAGTDSGTDYTSPNQVTNPPQPIALLTAAPFASNDVCGTFTFTRIDAPVSVPTPAAGSVALLGMGLALLGAGVLVLRRRAATTA
jgi:hypothetical protein